MDGERQRLVHVSLTRNISNGETHATATRLSGLRFAFSNINAKILPRSRQLWWGHQCPVYYAKVEGEPDGQADNDRWFAGRSEAEAQEKANKALAGKTFTLVRDEDVLDTWFSSGLWPFSTLGWPETTDDLEKLFPTTMLETGWDILFFWIARYYYPRFLSPSSPPLLLRPSHIRRRHPILLIMVRQNGHAQLEADGQSAFLRGVLPSPSERLRWPEDVQESRERHQPSLCDIRRQPRGPPRQSPHREPAPI